MDIVRFSGGLGNQMFQYAFMEALKSRGREVKASLGFYNKHPDAMRFSLCHVFPNVVLEYVSDREFDAIDRKWKKIKHKGFTEGFYQNISERFFWVEDIANYPCVYQPDVFKTKNCVFVGCWQTEKYFRHIRDQLMCKFRFAGESSILRDFVRELSGEIYVSVHIRRGDYLANPDSYMGICTEDYYKAAIEYIRKKEPDAKFIFFSDDMEWVKNNICVSDALFCEKSMFTDYEDWFDMYLMSQCRHNIIANSSFSWWGAWLNFNKNKIVVAPNKWLGYSDTPDIWCKEWVRL